MCLEIPAGGCEPGETPIRAAQRELAEEAGLAAADWEELGSTENANGMTTAVAHLFLARKLSATVQESQADERIDLAAGPAHPRRLLRPRTGPRRARGGRTAPANAS
jgi:8-oxo-dGTP pyrophosphatase MutT (NUDIX family)